MHDAIGLIWSIGSLLDFFSYMLFCQWKNYIQNELHTRPPKRSLTSKAIMDIMYVKSFDLSEVQTGICAAAKGSRSQSGLGRETS